jgi:exonuclease SbcC
MIPLRLKVTGFLSYLEPAELDFSQFELACISGANGAGKSSLLDAITWALFGEARKRDDALIHTNAKSAEVIFDFQYEGDTYRVQRSKPRDRAGVLEFFIRQNDSTPPAWKPLTERSISETQKRIRATLRMDFETFTNASFFLQGKADQFATQRPSDRKRILGSILGLEVWELYRERAVGRRKGLEMQVAALDVRLEEINGELAEGPTRQVRLAELEQELARLAENRQKQEELLSGAQQLNAVLTGQRRLVDEMARQLQAAQAGQERSQALFGSRREEERGYLQQIEQAAVIEGNHQAWQAARHALEAWEVVAGRFRQQEQGRSGILMEIEGERARLQQELESLRRDETRIRAALAEEPGLQTQVQAAQQAADLAGARLERRAALDVEIRQLHQAQADARAENPRLKAEMEELKSRLIQLEGVEGAACPVCGQPLEQAEREALMEQLRAEGRALGDRYRQNQALLREFEMRLAGMERELSGLTGAENELRQAIRSADQCQARLGQIRQAAQDWAAGGEIRLRGVGGQLENLAFAQDARKRLAELDEALRAIGYDAAAHEAARQAELRGRASEAALRALETARAALAPLQREIGGLAAQLAEQAAEVRRQQSAYDELSASYAAAAARLPDVGAAEAELMRLQSQENRRRMDVGAARQKVEVLDRLRTRQKGLQTERADLTRQIDRLKSLERAFGKDGVPALLIEQALPEIEAQANEILDRLSGGSMSVRFATQREFRDRNRDDKRETLDILISDGAGTRDYELFSGGEGFRVNFAIRLALSRVLAQRAGARLQTLVIDEGFGSQDAQGRQRLIEAINLVRPDFARILVITHLEELKEVFPNRIEVEKTLTGSRVRVM